MSSQRKQVSAPRVLNGILVIFNQAEENFIGKKVFPIVEVQRSNDYYWEYDMITWNTNRMQKRADGTESATVRFKKEKKYFDTEAEALKTPLTWKELEEADDVLNLEKSTIAFLKNQNMMNIEIDFLDNFFKTDIWKGSSTGSDLVGGTDFTKFDAAGSEPIKVIRKELLSIGAKSGFRGNKVVVGANVHEELVNHATIVDRVKHTSDKSVVVKTIAQLLEVKEYLVGSAATSTDGSMGFVYPDSILCVYAPDSPSKTVPSAGYIFDRKQKTTNGEVDTIDNEFTKETFYELEDEYDMKLVAEACGSYLTDCIG